MIKLKYMVSGVITLAAGILVGAQTLQESHATESEETQKAPIDSVAAEATTPQTELSAKATPRLNLFSEEMKEIMGRGMLEYIERTSYEMVNKGNAGDGELLLLKGSVADLKKIGPDTPVTVNTYGSNQMRVIWTLGGKEVVVAVPVGYDKVYEGTRSEIENRFIADIKSGGTGRRPFREIDRDELELYGDNLHILPGDYYQNRAVNRNLYLVPGETLQPVWDASYPRESIADLILYPSSAYGNVELELKVSRHDFGKTETLTVPLYNLIAAAESAGCTPYWGVEKFADGKLQGALFLYNSQQGYDHVVRLEMEPEAVIAGTGKINGRASLFIPTNNVDDLYQPYKKKSAKEKIKWQ